jgi:hypothetical protein
VYTQGHWSWKMLFNIYIVMIAVVLVWVDGVQARVAVSRVCVWVCVRVLAVVCTCVWNQKKAHDIEASACTKAVEMDSDISCPSRKARAHSTVGSLMSAS